MAFYRKLTEGWRLTDGILPENLLEQPMGVYEYRKDYDVGDLITARLPRFGIETDIRIVSVKEVYEGDKISIQPVFGELDSARTRILRALKK